MQADSLFLNINQQYLIPTDTYLCKELYWQLNYLFLTSRETIFWDTLTVDKLYTKLPELCVWTHNKSQLLAFLRGIISIVQQIYQNQLSEAKQL